MKLIPLTQGKFAMVDDEDFEMLSAFKWYAYKKKKDHTFYAMRKSRAYGPKQKTIYMHRFLLGIIEIPIVADHKNGDGLDNQRKNLRLCSDSQNQMNRRKMMKGSSAFKGVTANGKSWQAQIKFNGRYVYLGCFKTEREAALAYND